MQHNEPGKTIGRQMANLLTGLYDQSQTTFEIADAQRITGLSLPLNMRARAGRVLSAPAPNRAKCQSESDSARQILLRQAERSSQSFRSWHPPGGAQLFHRH